jgi:23S rRNA (cytosine1962-C5)-methyltransferase
MIPCILFEDDHLLVVNKPAGLNTHAPDPFAGEGLYDWLRHREPRWADLAIMQRLDKETSGVMVFGKTSLANRSLTRQFTDRTVRKEYRLWSARRPPRRELKVESCIARAGDHYIGSPRGQPATTLFRLLDSPSGPEPACLILAEPLTGRTHQIRVHAAENGFPVLGDTRYGGAPFHRVCLHAAELALRHPVDGRRLTFRAPADFAADTGLALRAALIDPEETNACRLIHGASDGWPGWWVDRLGDFVLSQAEAALSPEQRLWLERAISPRPRPASDATPAAAALGLDAPGGGAYHKTLVRKMSEAAGAGAGPSPVLGRAAPARFEIQENGLRYELSFDEGYSVGLFLDQRDNRRRLLNGWIAANFPLLQGEQRRPDAKPALLNAFAYTCGFSVCAARAGLATTSLDLSRKYLEWGRRNFTLNGLDPDTHEFIYGDAVGWVRRMARKGRVYEVIVLDPPTFSRSKERGDFRVEEDCPDLVRAMLPLLRPGGILFVSTNAANWAPRTFVSGIEAAVLSAGREILQRHFAPQPPDFPACRSAPAYLKTLWLRIA